MKYLCGKLTEREIVGLLRWVYLRRRTGTLEVGEGYSKKRLHFIAGELYIARSHPLAERVDRHLHVASAHPAGPTPTSPRRVAGGSPARRQEFDDLLGRIAEHLCAWQVESFRFIEGPVSAGSEVVGPLPTAQLLMEAAARNLDEAKLVARLGGEDSDIVTRPAEEDSAVVSELGPDDAFLYFQLQNRQPLSKYLHASAAERQRWLTALCRLWAVDLVSQASLRRVESPQSTVAAGAPAVESGGRREDAGPVEERSDRAGEAVTGDGSHPARGAAAANGRPKADHEPSAPPTVPQDEPWPQEDPWKEPAVAEPAMDDAVLSLWRDHFRLYGEPFSLTPDPAFLFLSPGHAEVLAGVKLGILERRGLIVVTGEVGTGKTTLVYSLLTDLGPRVETAYIANTALGFEEILHSALHDFEVPVPSTRRLDLLAALNRFLLASARSGRTVALVIDEAQNLSDEIFEELRLLLNFETYTSKLLQIVLVGQPELGIKLADPGLRQLADRVAVRCDLGRLSGRDTRAYIVHRLEAVGGSAEIFSRRALSLVVRKSRRVPRRINILCHNALLFAYGEGESQVDRAHVAEAAREMAPARGPFGIRRGRWRRWGTEPGILIRLAAGGRWKPLVAGFLAGLVAAALALAGFLAGSARGNAPAGDPETVPPTVSIPATPASAGAAADQETQR